MKLHEREKLTREASASLKESMIAWAKQYSERLTFAEEIKIVTSELSDWILGMTKYAIRDERHGDTSKPGGLACLAIFFVLALAATGCDVNVYTTPAPAYPTAQPRPLPPARTVCYPSGQCVCYGYPCRGPDAYRRPVYSGSYPQSARPRPVHRPHTHGPNCHHGQPSTGGPARPRPQAKPAKRGPAPRSKVRARPAPSRKGTPKKARSHAPR